MNTKIFIIALLLILSSVNILKSQDYPGDLGVINWTTSPIEVRIFARSISFDGFTFDNNSNEEYNRWDTLQNGSFCRYYTSQTNYMNYQLYYYYQLLNNYPEQLQLGLMGGNPSDENHGFGHGIYEVYIYVPSLDVMYKAYFNCLDSKYGAKINGLTYGRDFNFNYYGGSSHVEVTATPGNWSMTIYPYTGNNPIP